MKVFQIGFSKCGTCSMFHFFKKNGINSVHWRTKDDSQQNIVAKALHNKENNKKFFNGLDYVFYSDMIYIDREKVIYFYERFEEIYKDYPDSKFIFNIRNEEDWIKSQKSHSTLGLGKIFDRLQEILDCDEEEATKFLRNHYKEHTEKVKDFFKDKLDQLLIFKLGENTGEDIANFITEYNFQDKEFPHVNKTNN